MTTYPVRLALFGLGAIILICNNFFIALGVLLVVFSYKPDMIRWR